MSGQGYEELIVLNRKLDELLNKYSTLKAEIEELRRHNKGMLRMLEEKDEKIKELEVKYERIKITGALLGDGGNGAEAKSKINDLVREIDRCVALLNG